MGVAAVSPTTARRFTLCFEVAPRSEARQGALTGGGSFAIRASREWQGRCVPRVGQVANGAHHEAKLACRAVAMMFNNQSS
jgi:hypothetical protein